MPFYVYLLSNQIKNVIYTGMTSDLKARVWQHKTGIYPSAFTKKYQVHNLMYFEEYQFVQDALVREKQIKSRNRRYKDELIHATNPEWKDLSSGWYE